MSARLGGRRKLTRGYQRVAFQCISWRTVPFSVPVEAIYAQNENTDGGKQSYG